MNRDDLPEVFVTHAAGILGDTAFGLSGSQIVELTAAHAADTGTKLPHPGYPFPRLGVNKRTALRENLMAFAPARRFLIIRELCDHPTIQQRNQKAANDLKVKLFTQYGHLAPDGGQDLNEPLIAATRHWLDPYPEALALFNDALRKFENHVFTRNVLDDLRLSLEKLLKAVLGNAKPLEKQGSDLGAFIKARGGSPELRNMFVTLVDYYSKYQNSYVKHDDAVIEEEVEFLFETTASLMKHVVRLARRSVA
jgi:hypothetical protein